MSLGDYDDAEHERRETHLQVDPADLDDNPDREDGEESIDAGASVDDLLDQFAAMQEAE